MNAQVIGPSVAGQPVVHVTAVIVLVLLTFARTWVEAIVVVAHEGAHIVVSILTGRYDGSFRINETTGGGGTKIIPGLSAGAILSGLAGYMTPPAVGLLGANLVIDGRSWSVLWASVLLLLAAFFQAGDFFTGLVVLLAGGAIGWVAVSGGPDLQAGVAVALVWLMLMGGISTLIPLGLGGDPKSDAGKLARYTLIIPAFLWVALFWFVAIVCLWVGGRRMLGI